MKEQKRLQDMTIKDSFMFGAVMCDEENCKRLLELAIDIPIESVTVSREKCIVYHPEYKGVRLDICAKDEAHTHYNVEMQVAQKPALGKRTRYYHSQLDMEMLESGRHYRELPDAYVIFICDYDPFGKKRYRYTWEMICREEPALVLSDGCRTIILSTYGEDEDDVPAELVEFLKFVRADAKSGGLQGADLSSQEEVGAYVRRLQASVEHVKASREMEARYMLWKEMIQEEREESFAEGLAIGREEGLATAYRGIIMERILELADDVSEKLAVYLRQESNPDVLKACCDKMMRGASIEEIQKLFY